MSESLRLFYLSPHPDDAAIYPGGTIAKYASQGVEVMVVDATDGEKGKIAHRFGEAGHLVGRVPLEHEFDKLKAIRSAEEQRAAEILGISHLGFLHYPDTGVDEHIIPDIKSVLKDFDPHVVMTFSETGTSYEPHKADHAWTGIATYFALLELLKERPNSIPSFMRYITYTLPDAGSRFQNYAEVNVPSNELIHVDVSDQIATKLSAVYSHGTQRHLMHFFHSVGLFHVGTEHFQERLRYDVPTATGSDDIFFGSEQRTSTGLVISNPLPQDKSVYVSNRNIYDHTVDRVGRVTKAQRTSPRIMERA